MSVNYLNYFWKLNISANGSRNEVWQAVQNDPSIKIIQRRIEAMYARMKFDTTVIECECFCLKNINGYVQAGWRAFLDDNVHLCPVAFSQSDDDLAKTIVHEMSHLYIGTIDHAYYRKGKYTESLQTAQLVETADAYAFYIYSAINIRAIFT